MRLALRRTGGSEYLSDATTYRGRHLDARGRKRGGWCALEQNLFTILCMSFREPSRGNGTLL
jgi:hypothetical protein